MYRGMGNNKNKGLDTNLATQKRLPKGIFFQADQCLSVLKSMELHWFTPPRDLDTRH